MRGALNYGLCICLLASVLAPIAFSAKKEDDLILCRSAECNTPAPGAEAGEESIYIVTFKAAGGSSIKTGNQLLDEFNKNLPADARTHHYRPSQAGGAVAGRICVDGQAGKNAIVEMLAQSETLVLVSAKPATAQELAELGIAAKPSAKKQTKARASGDRLSFDLRDIYGRRVLSEDYAGVPVLIMMGSCWCGGCQQDAEPLRRIAEEYQSRGLAVIRGIAGDNELAAVEFQRHYRLKFPQLLDTDRRFEKQYNSDGWTFLMLADGRGNVVYRCNSPIDDHWPKVRALIEEMLGKGVETKPVSVEGVSYMPATLQRSGEKDKPQLLERFTSTTCGPNDSTYVMFTTNRNGNSDVYMRIFDGNQWSEDRAIAATAADEFDGTAIADTKGKVWVSWTSDAEGKNYNIFCTTLNGVGQPDKPARVTDADDDAMHARMACDDKGRIWITYYKWRKMGEWSRDKEVYVRRWEAGKWSDEVQVSPTDVPDYEDHTEPVIAGYGNGAAVVWAWDFHQPAGYTKNAANPTIFVRRIGNDFTMGKPEPVSATDIDVTPTVAVAGGNRIWCAWDSQGYDKAAGAIRKRICVRAALTSQTTRQEQTLNLSEPVFNVCTPTLAVSGTGKATLLWSQTADGTQWTIKRAELDPNTSSWSKPQVVESQGNPRYCSACYDGKGGLWVAYSVQTEKGKQIAVRNLGEGRL